MRKLALQHRCTLRNHPASGFRHSVGNGRGPRKCRWCGGDILVTAGLHAVVPHRGDGRYSADQAVALYVSPSAADKRASADQSLVVRFLPEGMLP